MARKETRLLLSALFVGAAFHIAVPTQAQLAGLWQFEDDFTDSSANGNDGAGVNGVNFVTGQATFGQAGNFSGADTHVLVSHDTSLDITSTGTFAAWVNADGNAWEGILAKSPSNGSSPNQAGNYELRLENSTQNMTFLYQRGGTNDTNAVGGGASTQVSSTGWQHVAVTVDGSGPTETVNYYLNGALVNTVSGQANGFGATNTNSLYIGSRADLFTDFHGQLDDVAIFNEVLDVNQINDIMGGDFGEFGLASIISGVSATASSELVGSFDRAAAYTTDSPSTTIFDPAAGTHSSIPDGSMWLTGGNDVDPEITFDFGEVYQDLERITVWNYNESTGTNLSRRGIQDTRILVSEDGVIYTALTDPTDSDQVFRFDQAPQLDNVDFSQEIDVNVNGTNIRYVKFDIISNWYGDNLEDANPDTDSGFVGLSQVQFYQFVPEPSSLALVSLGGLALLRRRR